VLRAALLALAFAGEGAPTIVVETPRDGRPHRVTVRGLDAATLARLGAAGTVDRGLAVFTGDGSAADTPAIAGRYAVDEEGLHFRPRFPFVSGVRYTARFRSGRTVLKRGFAVAPPEGTAPEVRAVYPSQAVLPENTLRLYLHFSQAMRAREAARHVHLFDAAGAGVPLPFVDVEPGLWDPQQRRLTLIFHPGRLKRGIAPGERMGTPLRAGQDYRLVVDGDLSDDQGRPLGRAHEHAFRVGAADRTSPAVADVVLEPPASPGAPLVLRLPEPLDHALLQRLVWVEGPDGERVEGEVAVDDGETRWTFRPRRPWAAGPHAVRVHPALEDRAGNRFDRLFDREVTGAEVGAEEEPYGLPFTTGAGRSPVSTPPAGP
jgi:hypothetical protein